MNEYFVRQNEYKKTMELHINVLSRILSYFTADQNFIIKSEKYLETIFKEMIKMDNSFKDETTKELGIKYCKIIKEIRSFYLSHHEEITEHNSKNYAIELLKNIEGTVKFTKNNIGPCINEVKKIVNNLSDEDLKPLVVNGLSYYQKGNLGKNIDITA